MRLRRPAAIAAILCIVLAGPALAQSSLGIGSPEVSAQPGSGAFFSFIAAQQKSFFSELRMALVGIRNGAAGLWWLVGLSFAYGIFHAAGPGHGKAVISSYMLANEVQLRRGVVLSFLSSLVQALAALVLVGAGWYLLRGTGISMTQAGTVAERASYVLVIGFGAALLAAKARSAVLLWRPRARSASLAFAGLSFEGAGHYSGAEGSAGRGSHSFSAEPCTSPQGDDCGCGRIHMADPALLDGERLGWRPAAAAVFATGLRPCAGAIVVLTFSLVNGLYLAGILSVFAMALGTAITVSIIACMAVFAKERALRLGSGRAATVRQTIEIAAAVALIALGSALLIGSFAGA